MNYVQFIWWCSQLYLTKKSRSNKRWWWVKEENTTSQRSLDKILKNTACWASRYWCPTHAPTPKEKKARICFTFLRAGMSSTNLHVNGAQIAHPTEKPKADKNIHRAVQTPASSRRNSTQFLMQFCRVIEVSETNVRSTSSDAGSASEEQQNTENSEFRSEGESTRRSEAIVSQDRSKRKYELFEALRMKPRSNDDETELSERNFENEWVFNEGERSKWAEDDGNMWFEGRRSDRRISAISKRGVLRCFPLPLASTNYT